MKNVMDMIYQKMCTDPSSGSRRLIIPGKRFLSLDDDSVRSFGMQRDKDGVILNSNAMMRWEMELNLNGVREEGHLTSGVRWSSLQTPLRVSAIPKKIIAFLRA